jgi:hypothetical protein
MSLAMQTLHKKFEGDFRDPLETAAGESKQH